MATLTVQELIDELNTIEDKTQEVYVYAYPEWDNCAFDIPISKERIWKDYFSIKHMKKITNIVATCYTEDVDDSNGGD